MRVMEKLDMRKGELYNDGRQGSAAEAGDDKGGYGNETVVVVNIVDYVAGG